MLSHDSSLASSPTTYPRPHALSTHPAPPLRSPAAQAQIDEVAAVAKAMNGGDESVVTDLAGSGVVVAGVKYMFVRGDKSEVYVKKVCAQPLAEPVAESKTSQGWQPGHGAGGSGCAAEGGAEAGPEGGGGEGRSRECIVKRLEPSLVGWRRRRVGWAGERRERNGGARCRESSLSLPSTPRTHPPPAPSRRSQGNSGVVFHMCNTCEGGHLWRRSARRGSWLGEVN